MEFMLIASAHFTALLSPGPDFFLIIQTALRLPRMYAAALCCGIAAANGIYIAIAVAGLESLRQFDGVLQAMKYCGGMYLVFIGIALVKAPRRNLEYESSNFYDAKSVRRQFGIGFFSAILNPKNMIFYLSLFTVMVGEKTPAEFRALYGVWMCLVVLGWDLVVANVIGNEAVKKRYSKFIFNIEKLAGGILAAFGILLSFS